MFSFIDLDMVSHSMNICITAVGDATVNCLVRDR